MAAEAAKRDLDRPKIEIRGLNPTMATCPSEHNMSLVFAISISAFIRSVGLRQIDVAPRSESNVRLVPPGSGPKAKCSSAAATFWPMVDVAELRYRVGMVFQKPTPFPMSVFDNVAFGLRLVGGIRGAELKSRVESRAARCGDLG